MKPQYIVIVLAGFVATAAVAAALASNWAALISMSAFLVVLVVLHVHLRRNTSAE